MRIYPLAILCAVSCGALAEDCREVKEDAARLVCWDNEAKSLPPPSARDPKSWPFGSNVGELENPPAPAKLLVREKLTAPYEDGKAISLSLTSANGEQVLKTNAALVYDLGSDAFGDSMRRAGWSTWIGAQWVKDANSKKPVDGRLARLAALGTLGGETKVHTMVAFEFAQDNIAKAKTFGLRPEFMPVILNVTEGGTPYSTGGGYSAYVKYGAQFDRVRFSKAPNKASGAAAGLNLKLNLNYYPGGDFAPLRFFTDIVRARDLYAGSEIEKRSSTYYDFGAEWMFTRPDKKAPAVAPTLGIHRTIGDNFLTGTARSVQTVLSFGLKIN